MNRLIKVIRSLKRKFKTNYVGEKKSIFLLILKYFKHLFKDTYSNIYFNEIKQCQNVYDTWPILTWRDAQHQWSSRKCRSKPQVDTTPYPWDGYNQRWPCYLAIPLTDIYPSDMKTDGHAESRQWIFGTAFFITALEQRQSKKLINRMSG